MQKRNLMVLSVLFAICFAAPETYARSLNELKILYVGDKSTPRASSYAEFLMRYAAGIESIDRHGFNPSSADGFDVVLLDWPQGPETREMRLITSPLGARDKWRKPTVLLGSAGLNLAVAWKLKGGVGCTCLDPLAYDVRDHEIFDAPYKIDRSLMKSIPTPADFRDEIPAPTIRVLPLVDDLAAGQGHRTGWCTYTADFSRYPDVELFCGGVNHKTPTAGALWRQGNLLHFGFDLSPAEMNDTGRLLLLNSIAYISRFTEDRPIAVTPSVFAGKVAPSNEWILRHLRNPVYPTEMFTSALAPEVLQLAMGSRERMLTWAQANARYLHPNSEQLLEFDQDLRVIKTPFDEPAFLDALVKLLDGPPADQSRAARLIARYLPDFTGVVSAQEFKAWLDDNRPYLFASDSGDYRWYIDLLARKRQVPTAELRGVRRADVTRPSVSG